LIASNRSKFPYIHDLRELWTQCTDLGEVFPALPWNPLDLQDYAVFLRYESTDILPPEDRDKMREAVDILTWFVEQRAETLNFGE
jgi:hypothetical protein